MPSPFLGGLSFFQFLTAFGGTYEPPHNKFLLTELLRVEWAREYDGDTR